MIRFYFTGDSSPSIVDKFECKFNPKVGARVRHKQRTYEVVTVVYNLDEDRYEVYLNRKSE